MKNNSTVVLKYACITLLVAINISANAEQMTAKQLADWANLANQTKKPNFSQPQYPISSQQYNARNVQNPFFSASYQPVINAYGITNTGGRERYPIGPPTLKCVVEAARRQNVPPDLLLAINSIERGKTGQSVGNSNGTDDIGAFQINSIHLDRLASYKATRNDIATRGCYNAEVAAFLLNEAINHPKMQHLDFYSRASGYHSWTPEFNAIYRTKLIKYHNDWKVWLNSQNLQALVSNTTVGL